MNIEDLREYCIKKPYVTEGLPFGPSVLVLKVMEKVFLLCPLDTEGVQMNLKCDPEWAIELREKYFSVQPGFHTNKKHWNTVYCNYEIPDKLIYEMIDHSFNLVVSKLPKADRLKFA